MSSLYSSSTSAVTDKSRDGTFLESDLKLLMAALRDNNSDNWEGKPQQETFCVYQMAPPVATTLPSSSGAEVADAARGSSLHSADKSDDSSDSLNALMRDYVHAVRGLRAFDSRMAANSISENVTAEPGDATDGMVDAKKVATTPCKATVGDGNSSAVDAKLSEAAAPVDMVELLAALDCLPPITMARKGQQS
ncbi:hypothetical protein Q4I30_000837 [Leishmania utingensis]|uniref:Uncharacterized protein n=1 Tax=Leishmania utingensis TaxID=653362 RepID=A0AAW3B1P1_9TRYP